MNYTIKFAGKGKAKPTDIDWMYYSPKTYKSDTKYTIVYEGNDQQNYIYGTEPANSDIGRYFEIELGNNALLETVVLSDVEIEPTRDAIHGEPPIVSSSLTELWRALRIESSDLRWVVFRKQSQLR